MQSCAVVRSSAGVSSNGRQEKTAQSAPWQKQRNAAIRTAVAIRVVSGWCQWIGVENGYCTRFKGSALRSSCCATLTARRLNCKTVNP